MRRTRSPADPAAAAGPAPATSPAGYAPRHAVGYVASGGAGHQAVTGAAIFIGLVLAAGVILAGSRTSGRHPGDVAQARPVPPAVMSSAAPSQVAYVGRPTALGVREATRPRRAGDPAPTDTPTGAAQPSLVSTELSTVSTLAAGGIPTTALRAYRLAATREATRRPGCGLSWPLLAGIGRVESNHGRFAGARLYADGYSIPRIVGIPLDGHGTALIRDTDGGRWDGDRVFDRAVGPMQFIPSTWAGWGVDADHDGRTDPNDLFDAAAAAADYLCAAGRDVRTYAGAVRAVRSYNNSDSYIATVLGTARAYAAGRAGLVVPDAPGSGRGAPPVSPGTVRPGPKLPPVDPGRPRGLPPGSIAAVPPGGGLPVLSASASGVPTSGVPTSGVPSSAVSSPGTGIATAPSGSGEPSGSDGSSAPPSGSTSSGSTSSGSTSSGSTSSGEDTDSRPAGDEPASAVAAP